MVFSIKSLKCIQLIFEKISHICKYKKSFLLPFHTSYQIYKAQITLQYNCKLSYQNIATPLAIQRNQDIVYTLRNARVVYLI